MLNAFPIIFISKDIDLGIIMLLKWVSFPGNLTGGFADGTHRFHRKRFSALGAVGLA